MYVIGTAGHVDHGKSRLVLALTGMDPDRLQEEKDRGLTIDLGFAWLTLPSKKEVSIIDVPGHERFIKNMLAGVGGIDVALLVIAADEGVMQQTREHVEILDLLKVRKGIVALTKSDLVTNDWMNIVEEDVLSLLEQTTLANSVTIRCSAATGEGLEQLRTSLDSAIQNLPPPTDNGQPRLAIDRTFSISGFGTLVTGTLINGHFRKGDKVSIEPGGKSARIRGLQSHKKNVDIAKPGARTAINLSGVTPEELVRGMVVTNPGWLHATKTADVRMRLIDRATKPLQHNATVTLHTGASEVVTRVRLLEDEHLPPGREGWAQLRFNEPIAAARGDYFVIRDPNGTIGGGQIVDMHPRRHKRNDKLALKALQSLSKGTTDDTILTVLRQLEPITFKLLRIRSELDGQIVDETINRQVSEGAIVILTEGGLTDTSVLTTHEGFLRLTNQALEVVTEFVNENPLTLGIPMEALRSRLKLPTRAFAGFEYYLVTQGILTSKNTRLDLPNRSVSLSSKQKIEVNDFLKLVTENGRKPTPTTSINQELKIYLESWGAIINIGDGLCLSQEIHTEMTNLILAKINKQKQLTLAEARDILGTNRKVAQSFLEDMDRRKITRRKGDTRVLRGT